LDPLQTQSKKHGDIVMGASKNAWLKAIQIFGICVAILIEFLFVQNQVSAETIGTNILFILDGSGSMWGRLDNVEKIVTAKEVMTELVNDFPEGINIGLEVYGHRRKGDCGDIEMLESLGKGDKATIIRKIESISPKGKTPITKSIELAAKQLETLEEETTIVLVSDGKETCKGNPCTLVKTLKERGINFTMHVIGFDVTKEERAQLACIAEAGGGRYFTAKNAIQLKEAFTEVKTEMIEKVEISKGKRSVFGSTKEMPFSLRGDIYFLQAETQHLPNFNQLKPVGSIYTTKLNIPTRRFDKGFPGVTDRFEWFAIDYNGTFKIDEAGDIRFRLTSDDGSKLFIDGILVIDNDGIHPTEPQTTTINLDRGIHKIRVQYFQGPRYEVALVLEMAKKGGNYQLFNLKEMAPTNEIAIKEEPSQTPQLIIDDVFNQNFDASKYRWVGTENKKHRLTTSGLELYGNNGAELFQDNQKVSAVYSRRVTAQPNIHFNFKVSGTPTTNWQQIGIILMQDADNYVRLTTGYINDQFFVEFSRERRRKFQAMGTSITQHEIQAGVELELIRRSDNFSAYIVKKGLKVKVGNWSFSDFPEDYNVGFAVLAAVKPIWMTVHYLKAYQAD
jgi:hypothetical protein